MTAHVRWSDLHTLEHATTRAALAAARRAAGDGWAETILSRDQVATIRDAATRAMGDWLKLHATRTAGGQWLIRLTSPDEDGGETLDDMTDEDIGLAIVLDEAAAEVLYDQTPGGLCVVPIIGAKWRT